MQPTARHPEGTSDNSPDRGESAASFATQLELGMRSVANGMSLASASRWFNIPEAELEARLDEVTAPEPLTQPENPAADRETASESTFRHLSPVPPPAPDEAKPDAPVNRLPSKSPTAPSRRALTVPASTRPVTAARRSGSSSSISLRDAFHVLRRRWFVLVAVAVLGVAGGWLTAPGTSRAPVSYRATHTLIYEPKGNQSFNIQQVALLATSGDVPTRVAARLKLDRTVVRSSVTAVANPDVSTIAITARNAESGEAVLLADVTAEELGRALSAPDQAAYDAQLKDLTGKADAARARLNAIPSGPKNAPDAAAARADVTAAEQALAQFKASTPSPDTQLRTLEAASAAAVQPAGVKAPDSKTGRGLLLGAFGLLAGIAGAFVLERMDSRIRSKSRAEEAFGVPVVAEVPPVGKALQGRLLTRTDATSPFIEAYRGLRTYVALWAPEIGEDDGHRVLLVSSPGASEGKTTTVAHLAAMLAELGRSVIVISADLRRPRIHQYFNLPAGPGLVDELAASPDGPDFSGLDQPTSVRGVRLVPSGPPVNDPAPLLEHAAELVRATRSLADFVLIDCPPLLVANDAVEMARHADGVLLVARSGATPIEAAERSAELLERLEIPVVGAVLVGSEAVSNASKYYTSRYYAEPERAGRFRRRHGGGNGRGPSDGPTSAPSSVGTKPPAAGEP